MNIEQYRALKAEQENQPKVEETQVQTVEQPIPEVVEDVKVVEPTKIEIDGKEITIEELKNGYLRQSDYTKKTQQVSNQRKESEEAIKFYEYLKQNPEAAATLKDTVGVPRQLDPTQSKIVELEQKMYDMMLENEIDTLSRKYDDFEAREVLEVASEKGMTNLEDAYKLLKSGKGTTDLVSLKEQLRKELLLEMKEESVSTKTIINDTSSHTIAPTSDVTLTPGEVRVAKGMGMSIQDYVSWRDAK